jgi:hypothetical protein
MKAVFSRLLSSTLSGCSQSMHPGRKALRTLLLSQLSDQCEVEERDPFDNAC